MRNALILMTRVPIPGKTKTRLETHLTPEQCAMLHTCFIKDIYKTAKKVNADVYIYYTPERHQYLMRAILGEKAELRPQIDGNLGDRMANAINQCLDMGYEKCVLIGTDIPTISELVLSRAFNALDSSEVVIGPTIDGGYYLIGMKKPHAEVFNDTFYGVNTVYKSTLYRMETLGIKYSQVDEWYDIDTYMDLKYMIDMSRKNECRIPVHTEKFLKAIGMIGCEGEEEYGDYRSNIE